MITLQKRNTKLRWAIIVCGLLIWLWLNPEDNHIGPAVVLGSVSASLLITFWGLGRFGGKQVPTRVFILLLALGGMLIGLAASLITAILMLLKNARHAHFFPDFPTGQILAVLELAPVWALAGLLAGIGFGLLIRIQRRNKIDAAS